jgi:hypothetical protein
MGIRSEVVMLAHTAPNKRDTRLNWDRLDGLDQVERVFAPRGHDDAGFAVGKQAS